MTAAGMLLFLCGAAAFVVFPLRRGYDLLVPVANLLLGALLVRVGRKDLGGGRSLAAGALLAVAPLVLFRGLTAAVHEVGEIVVLRTSDDRGSVWETRVAVLDHDGSTWIGADRAGQRWVGRLAANPRLELVRGGIPRCRVAVPVEDVKTREEVFRRIEEKYLVGRLATALGRPLFVRRSSSPERASVAFRLDPCRDEG